MRTFNVGDGRAMLAAALCAAFVAGCSASGNSVVPQPSPVNLQATDKLQFVVGTINEGVDNATGINMVATFRQQNGNTATLVNNPTVTLPAGAVIPSSTVAANGKGGSGTDAGGNVMTSYPPTYPFSSTAQNTTFGPFVGVYSYGFGPFNLATNAAESIAYPGYPQHLLFSSTNTGTGNLYYDDLVQPMYSTAIHSADMPFLGGPPAYPYFNDGTYPEKFAGYSQGFLGFVMPIVSGAYQLQVVVPNSDGANQTFSATAQLTNTAVMALPTVTFAPDTSLDGGATGTVTASSGPNTFETMVYVKNFMQETYYTMGPFYGDGTFNYTLPSNLGIACTASGCAAGPTMSPSFLTSNPAYASGPDKYGVMAVSYDYPAFEASPPGNTQQMPTLTGTNTSGQADLAISAYLTGSY